MLRSIFAKTVRDQRRSLLWWGLGLVALTVVTVLYYPTIRDTPELNRMMENLPEGLRALIGGEADLLSAAGYLNSQLFSLMVPLLFLIYAIGLGAAAIAGEEERGKLDLLLAQPVGRRRLVLDTFAALATLLAALGVVLWLAVWTGARLVELPIGGGRLAAATASAALMALLFGTLALALGGATGRRSLALGVGAAVAAAGYVLNGMAPLVDALAPLRRLSPFYYAVGADPLRNGLEPAHVAVLMLSTAALLLLTLVAFDRRDIAV